MINYTLHYLRWESSLEEFGDDFVTFYFQVKPENEEPFLLLFQYRNFKDHLQQLHPEIFNLLEKAEKSSTKWGSNESVFIKELEEYGIDIGKLVLDIAPLIFDFEAEIERNKGLIANPPNFDNFLIEIQESVSKIKATNEIYYHLCEELKKSISQKIVELYPVLINSSSENITKLEEILANNIPNLAGELHDLIRKAEEN